MCGQPGIVVECQTFHLFIFIIKFINQKPILKKKNQNPHATCKTKHKKLRKKKKTVISVLFFNRLKKKKKREKESQLLMWGWVVGSEHIWSGCSHLQRRFRRVSRRHIECWLNKSLQSVLRTSTYSKEIKIIIIITTYSILVLLYLVYKKNESWKWEFEGKN